MTRWKNKKSGKFYVMLAHATDATMKREGIGMIIYSPEANPHIIFAREEKEFFEKFENAGPVLPGNEPWNKGK